MASIIHLMGPTCAGKSTIIDKLTELSQDVFTVQIGKILRKKYGEDYFKGQAAPEHTRDEALNLYFETINEGISQGKKLILVDGQPRDLDQARVMMKSWPDHRSSFLMVHAEHSIREARARAGRKPGPDLDLAVARLVNDYRNCYVVMIQLLAKGYKVDVVDTGADGFDVPGYCQDLLDKNTREREST